MHKSQYRCAVCRLRILVLAANIECLCKAPGIHWDRPHKSMGRSPQSAKSERRIHSYRANEIDPAHLPDRSYLAVFLLLKIGAPQAPMASSDPNRITTSMLDRDETLKNVTAFQNTWFTISLVVILSIGAFVARSKAIPNGSANAPHS